MRRATIRKLACAGMVLGVVGIGAMYQDPFNAHPKTIAYKNAVSVQKEACLRAFKKGVLLEDCKAFSTPQDKKESRPAKETTAQLYLVVSCDPEVASAVIKRKAAAQEYFPAAAVTFSVIVASLFTLLISQKWFYNVTTLRDTTEFLSGVGTKLSNLARSFRKNPDEQRLGKGEEKP